MHGERTEERRIGNKPGCCQIPSFRTSSDPTPGFRAWLTACSWAAILTRGRSPLRPLDNESALFGHEQLEITGTHQLLHLEWGPLILVPYSLSYQPYITRYASIVQIVNIFDFRFKLLIGTHAIETNETGLIICSCSCRSGRVQRKAGEYVVLLSQ